MRFTITLVTILLAGNAAYAKNYNTDKPYGKYTCVEPMDKTAKMKEDIILQKKKIAMVKPQQKVWDRNK